MKHSKILLAALALSGITAIGIPSAKAHSLLTSKMYESMAQRDREAIERAEHA